MKLYLLTNQNGLGDDGFDGAFSSLAALEEYQFKNHLKGMMHEISVIEIDKPESLKDVPELIRLASKYEEKFFADPNYKKEKLEHATLFCDDCKKQLTACWECHYYHCKCETN